MLSCIYVIISICKWAHVTEKRIKKIYTHVDLLKILTESGRFQLLKNIWVVNGFQSYRTDVILIGQTLLRSLIKSHLNLSNLTLIVSLELTRFCRFLSSINSRCKQIDDLYPAVVKRIGDIYFQLKKQNQNGWTDWTGNQNNWRNTITIYMVSQGLHRDRFAALELLKVSHTCVS